MQNFMFRSIIKQYYCWRRRTDRCEWFLIRVQNVQYVDQTAANGEKTRKKRFPDD